MTGRGSNVVELQRPPAPPAPQDPVVAATLRFCEEPTRQVNWAAILVLIGVGGVVLLALSVLSFFPGSYARLATIIVSIAGIAVGTAVAVLRYSRRFWILTPARRTRGR